MALVRLGSRDKLLLAALLPIWAVCFGLSVRSAVSGVGFPPVVVSAPLGAEEYPAVSGFSLELASESGLRVGDRLLRMGTADLRGVGFLGFFALAAEEAGPDRVVTVVFERAGERFETTLRLGSYALVWPLLLVSFGFALSGVVVLLRARPSQLVRAWFLALLCLAIVVASKGFGASRWEVYASSTIFITGATLIAPLSLRALLLHSPDAPPMRWFVRVGPWLFGPLLLLFLLGLVPYPLFLRTLYVLALLLGATLLVLATRIYRSLDPIGRRQAKWVLWGGYCALLPRLAVAAWIVIQPEVAQRPVYLLSYLALLLFPVSLLIAIARFNFFDVDRLLSATASYNLVLVALVGTGLVVVPWLGELSSGLLGVEPRMGQAALSLALAALVIPVHQRLRPRIDRVFFKERYAFDQGVAELLRALSACQDTRALTQRVGEELHQLLQPESFVIYARAGDSFAPVFVAGRAVPVGFEAGSPLVATLAQRRKPLALSHSGRRPDAAALGPFDRAALEALEVEVVVPVRREGLAAFLCLGPKRSGDVYTSTDLSHLAAVAEAVSSQLRNFDQEQVIRSARDMQESLRRYVPGAIADQLASGSELEASEREVSVLFVDIRGYTSFSEPRRAAEIFSTVNHYTETVSAIVRKHGGSVVEFNGDGMMAVFGAPRDIAHKERAAVEAAREIAAAVGSMPVVDAQRGEAKLSVGVGIATGEAFVGNIRAVDRMIWSVLGNTTNLAARLQSLTRDLKADVVIDAATREASGGAAADFVVHPRVPIRGRLEREDVYALQLGAR